MALPKRKTPGPGECPCCGADVPPRALSCPECGADERTGWGGDDTYDGLDLPDAAWENHDDRLTRQEFSKREAGTKRVAWLLLAAFLTPLLGGLLWLIVRK